jgi:CRP-like cAMP-binding protein
MDRNDMARRLYRNRCLAFLPEADIERLERRLQPVSFEVGDLVLQPDEPISRVIFLETGLIAYLTLMEDGSAVESLTIGPDGAVGLMGGVGVPQALRQARVSVEGDGFALPIADMQAAVLDSPAMREMTLRANAATLGKLLQLVACNAKHGLEQRLARRLLACSDASDARRFALTQEALADTLGVRRTSITAAARTLRAEGLIGYRHGRVWIEDPAGLEARACECRRVIRSEIDSLLPRGAGPPTRPAPLKLGRTNAL